MNPWALINDPATGVLTIHWDDGAKQQLRASFLRQQCQCATCSSLRNRRNESIATGESLRITEIAPVGNYAMQLIFSDGHARGIFPWQFLRQLRDKLMG